MFTSFDDISSVKPYNGSITTLPAKKRKVSNSPSGGTSCCIWIIVLLILICCLLVSIGTSVLLWHELKSFQDDFYKASQLSTTENAPIPDITVSTNCKDTCELEPQMLEIMSQLKKINYTVLALEVASALEMSIT